MKTKILDLIQKLREPKTYIPLILIVTYLITLSIYVNIESRKFEEIKNRAMVERQKNYIKSDNEDLILTLTSIEEVNETISRDIILDLSENCFYCSFGAGFDDFEHEFYDSNFRKLDKSIFQNPNFEEEDQSIWEEFGVSGEMKLLRRYNVLYLEKGGKKIEIANGGCNEAYNWEELPEPDSEEFCIGSSISNAVFFGDYIVYSLDNPDETGGGGSVRTYIYDLNKMHDVDVEYDYGAMAMSYDRSHFVILDQFNIEDESSDGCTLALYDQNLNKKCVLAKIEMTIDSKIFKIHSDPTDGFGYIALLNDNSIFLQISAQIQVNDGYDWEDYLLWISSDGKLINKEGIENPVKVESYGGKSELVLDVPEGVNYWGAKDGKVEFHDKDFITSNYKEQEVTRWISCLPRQTYFTDYTYACMDKVRYKIN